MLLVLVAGCGQNNATTADLSGDDLSGVYEDLSNYSGDGAPGDGPRSDGPRSDGSQGDGPLTDGPWFDFSQLDALPADLAGVTSTVGTTNQVGCGAVSCASPQFCCIKTSGYDCEGGDGLMCTFSGGHPLFCDSTASTCTGGGRVCCLRNGVADCSLGCAGGIQLCSPAGTECTTGTCKPYTGTQLPAGYYTCQ
jgi:hypothetical protein